MDARVREIFELIRCDPAKQFTVGALADRVRISPSGLRLLFKRHVGLPPSRCLKQIRLERARVLLCTEHHSVKEIMAAVGFSDESHFVRDFENLFGLSPRKYRRQYFGALPSPDPMVAHSRQ